MTWGDRSQVGMYQVIYLNRSADDAYKALLQFKPFVPFRDASCGVSSFHLTVLDCLKVRSLLASDLFQRCVTTWMLHRGSKRLATSAS